MASSPARPPPIDAMATLASLEVEVSTTKFSLQQERLRRFSSFKESPAILDRLKQLDDDALTMLLTASTPALLKLISGGEKTSSILGIEPSLVPSKSAGIEGVGSGVEIDRRLTGTSLEKAKGKARQSKWMKEWLSGRKKRSTKLLTHLAAFTHLNITNITRSRRNITISTDAGTFKFVVTDMQVLQNLELTLPRHVEKALGSLSSRCKKRSDLPALLLAMRTMRTLVEERRRLFANLAEKYADLVRTRVPEQGEDEAAYGTDTLVFQGDRGRLSLHFEILFNRYGHSRPSLDFSTSLESGLADQLGPTLQRMIKLQTQQGQPVTPAITGIIDAFYNL